MTKTRDGRLKGLGCVEEERHQVLEALEPRWFDSFQVQRLLSTWRTLALRSMRVPRLNLRPRVKLREWRRVACKQTWELLCRQSFFTFSSAFPRRLCISLKFCLLISDSFASGVHAPVRLALCRNPIEQRTRMRRARETLQ